MRNLSIIVRRRLSGISAETQGRMNGTIYILRLIPRRIEPTIKPTEAAEGHAEKEQPDEKVALNNIFSCRQAAFFGLTRSRSFLSP